MCSIAIVGEGPSSNLHLSLHLDPGEQDSLQQISYVLNETNLPVELYEQSAMHNCSTRECFVHHCNFLDVKSAGAHISNFLLQHFLNT